MKKWGRKTPRKIVYLVGLYTVGYQIFDMSYAFFAQQFGGRLNFRDRYGQNSWVVISGAGNSVGLEFSKQMAKLNYNLILIDSEKEKLEEVRQKIEDMGREVKLEAITFDYERNASWQDYEALTKHIRDLTYDQPPAILINNAEKFDPQGVKFRKLSDEQVIDTVAVNTFPMLFMCRFLGPEMKKREKRSAIINMSSYYGTWNVYNMPIFSSTKSFQDVVSHTLSFENADMDVLTVKAMPVKSDRHPNGVEPTELVEGVLNDLGQQRISYGHWKHSLFRHYYLFRQCSFYFGGQQQFQSFRRW